MEQCTETRALNQLSENFTFRGDNMIRPKAGYKPNERDMEAIEFLFEEHNYGYTPGQGG